MTDRLLVIGLDSAERTLVDRWIASGHLPNLARVAAVSVTSTVRSDGIGDGVVWDRVLSSESAPHSVRFDPATYRAEAHHGTLGTPFFVGRAPRSVIVDVPGLRLEPSVAGTQVPFWGNSSNGKDLRTVPPELRARLDDLAGARPVIEDDHEPWDDPVALQALADRLGAAAQGRGRLVAELLRAEPDWAFCFTVFGETHAALEAFWHGVDPSHLVHGVAESERCESHLREVYAAVDAGVGEVLDQAGDASVVVFSPHGGDTNTGDAPSALLAEYLHRRDGGAPWIAGRPTTVEAWRAQGAPPARPSTYRWPAGGRPAEPLRAGLKRRAIAAAPGLARVVATARGRGEHRRSPDQGSWVGYLPPGWYQHAWPHRRAFALPTFDVGIVRFNVAGREASGSVPPEAFPAERQRLADELRALRDARTGRSAVEDIVERDGDPGDLHITWTRNVDALELPDGSLLGPVPLRRTGGHRPEGFAFAPGAILRAGRAHDVADLRREILAAMAGLAAV